MRKTKLCPIVLLLGVFMLVFFVGTAKASSESFVIGPKQEAIEYVDLYGSGHADGNVSVSIGQIDFFIKDPDGLIVQQFLHVSSASFSFTADKNGNYSMCMYNAYQASNVTVELDYGKELTIVLTATMHISSSSSVGTATVVAPPGLQLPDNDNGSDYVIEPYLTLQGAKQMFGEIESVSALLPIRNVNLIRFAASAIALAGSQALSFMDENAILSRQSLNEGQDILVRRQTSLYNIKRARR